VNLDIFDRRSAERFAQLLDETNGGLRHHARGQADDEQLSELVAIGHTLSAVRPAVHVDSEFRTGLRAMLVATAERDGIGATAAPEETAPGIHAAVREPRRGLLGKGTGRRIRARGAIVIGVAAGAIAVSGLSSASENAAPGDALYGVKRSTERAQMALAGSDVTRGQLSLDFARNRLAEAAALDGDNPAFADVLNDMDTDTKQGVRLLTTSAVARTDKAPLNAIDTFVTGQRRVLGPVLLDKLDTDNRERAATSLNLLDDIDKRARGLRAGLDCGSDGTLGADLLGPKPRACFAGQQSTDGLESDRGTGQSGTGEARTTGKARPGRSGEPVADPTVAPTGVAEVPAGDEAPAGPGFAPTGTASPAPADEPAPTPAEDAGLLDGIFGGLFG
jgi:hypothetical protein